MMRGKPRPRQASQSPAIANSQRPLPIRFPEIRVFLEETDNSNRHLGDWNSESGLREAKHLFLSIKQVN